MEYRDNFPQEYQKALEEFNQWAELNSIEPYYDPALDIRAIPVHRKVNIKALKIDRNVGYELYIRKKMETKKWIEQTG